MAVEVAMAVVVMAIMPLGVMAIVAVVTEVAAMVMIMVVVTVAVVVGMAMYSGGSAFLNDSEQIKRSSDLSCMFSQHSEVLFS